jgi:hypothetical protein
MYHPPGGWLTGRAGERRRSWFGWAFWASGPRDLQSQLDVDEHASDSQDPLDDIVRELLLERTSDLDAPRLAAFIDGWGSLLRLLDRTELILPGAPAELAEAFEAALRRVRESQQRVLDDD